MINNEFEMKLLEFGWREYFHLFYFSNMQSAIHQGNTILFRIYSNFTLVTYSILQQTPHSDFPIEEVLNFILPHSSRRLVGLAGTSLDGENGQWKSSNTNKVKLGQKITSKIPFYYIPIYPKSENVVESAGICNYEMYFHLEENPRMLK